MNVDLIIKVFELIDKPLKNELGEEEFKAHTIERGVEFWTALNRLTKNSIYSEFMEK